MSFFVDGLYKGQPNHIPVPKPKTCEVCNKPEASQYWNTAGGHERWCDFHPTFEKWRKKAIRVVVKVCPYKSFPFYDFDRGRRT